MSDIGDALLQGLLQTYIVFFSLTRWRNTFMYEEPIGFSLNFFKSRYNGCAEPDSPSTGSLIPPAQKSKKTNAFSTFQLKKARKPMLFQHFNSKQQENQCFFNTSAQKSKTTNAFSTFQFKKASLKSQIRNLKSEIRNLKSEVYNLKSEIWNLKSNIWNQKSKICSLQSEIWNSKSKIWNLKSEIWNLKYKIWNLKSEIRNLKHEIQNLKSKGWNMKSQI